MQERTQQTDTRLTQGRSRPVRRQQVYVIHREGGGVKVGISGRPHKRKSQLQSASPEKLTIAATYKADDAAMAEAELKQLLAPLRMKGEWFNIPAEAAKIAVEAVVDRDAAKLNFTARFVPYHQLSMTWERSLRSARGESWDLNKRVTNLARDITNDHRHLLARVNPWWVVG